MEALPVYSLSTEGIARLSREIREMAEQRNAVILAHNYQVGEVQDVAHYVGDSLGLSQEAARTDADVIVFCGVHFMAETAAILSPTKRVLIPDLGAGCSLSETINADQLRAWKAEHPGATVVSYVNCSAEVKAESDYCCTSGNAEKVIRSIPEDQEILFLPDMFLGAHLERLTGRHFIHGQPVGLGIYAGSLLQDNDADRMLAALVRVGLDVRPEAMGVTWDDVGEALRTLPAFVRSVGLWYTVADARPITEALIDRVRDGVSAAFGPWEG